MKMWSNYREPGEMDIIMNHIARIEDEIRQKYFQLGAIYYEDNKEKSRENIGEKYFEIVDALKKLNENQKNFYKNKLRLEGQMQCENCGKIIAYGSAFCTMCGEKIDDNPGNMMKKTLETVDPKCPKCGMVIEAGSVFCTFCGERVSD